MFCKNCGTELKPESETCEQCGIQKGVGDRFCANCGNELAPNAVVCGRCACPVSENANACPESEQKSKLVAGLLGILLGGYGVHSFYLGFTGRGILQIVVTLLTCGAGSLWGLIEGIMILCGNINKDAKGNPLSEQ